MDGTGVLWVWGHTTYTVDPSGYASACIAHNKFVLALARPQYSREVQLDQFGTMLRYEHNPSHVR